MGISELRDLSRMASSNQIDTAKRYGINSSSNFMFYGGTNGKSLLSFTQIDDDKDKPMLIVSAAGGSSYLQEEYPNAVIKTPTMLPEFEIIINDLEQNAKLLNTIQVMLNSDPSGEKLKNLRDNAFIPKYYSDDQEGGIADFEYLTEVALSNSFIFERVIIEEAEIISSLIQDKVELQFGSEILGEDKSLRGKDWAALSSELVSFYSRWLRLPCKTIIATGDKLPGEKEGLKKTIPVLCTGGAQRQLTSMIGNVFNVGNDEDGFYVMVKPSKKVLVRSKFFPLGTDFDKIPERLDITNNPELFWNFIKKCKNKEFMIDKKK